MKKKFNILRLIIALFAIGVLTSVTSFAQEKKEPAEPSVDLTYLRKTDGSIWLSSGLSYKTPKGWVTLTNFRLNCYAGSDSAVLAGSLLTDRKGKVLFKLPPAFQVPKDKDGLMHFKVEFAGNDTLAPANAEVSAKELIIEMKLDGTDSVKKVNLNVYSKAADGSNVPLKENTIMLYVPRMFSYLKVGEAKLDSAGLATIDFPGNLPGDSIGNITILAKIEESEEFGNVEKSEKIQWGIATRHKLPHSYRSLWSEVAPVWMIVTLTVMLIGVWGHYVFALIMLVKIKRSAKKTVSES